MMKYVKLFEDFNKGTLTLFRGQHDTFFNDKNETGYFKYYKMLYLTPYIDSAYFYTYPGRSEVREISVFKVPDNIARVSGAYIDRLGNKIDAFKEEGYAGVTSNVGELMYDRGEIGMFNLYSPVQRFQTKNGKFSDSDLRKLSKLGLSQHNIDREKSL